MAIQREISQNVLDDIVRELKSLRTDLNNLKAQMLNPTIPIMDSADLPANAVEGQIVIAP